MSVVIETTLGDITVDLFLLERPRACLNFLKLCKIKYYNYNLFHTISRGFIAQTGDPTGTRTGGESIFGVIDGPSKKYFEAENEPRIKHTRLGLISFVGDENNMIASQFFLTLGEDLAYLDEKHCVFGEVVEGYDILETINEVICDNDDRPYQDVRITHTVVLDDPYPDPKRILVPSRSPSPSAERLAGGRIAPDEEIDETSGKSAREVAEMQAEREAKARATILEMVGDIPDADMAPPENVLFVCKLNPMTNDDDLEIIFSRFGKIKSCEVIRDRKSGDSLQYAFVEFEDQKSCEDAYFKMNNVLIDDRRLHVDFSQSVSKVKWLGKGRGVKHFDEKGNKRKAGLNKDIGKGEYKLKNGSNQESLNKDKNTKSSKSPKRYREKSHSPKRKQLSQSPERSKRKSRSPQVNRKRSRSPRKAKQRSGTPLRKSESPVRKRRYSRSPDDSPRRNNRRYSPKRWTRSPAYSRGTSKRVTGRYSPERRSSSYRRWSRSPWRATRSAPNRKSYFTQRWSRSRRSRSTSQKSKSPRRSRSPKRKSRSPALKSRSPIRISSSPEGQSKSRREKSDILSLAARLHKSRQSKSPTMTDVSKKASKKREESSKSSRSPKGRSRSPQGHVPPRITEKKLSKQKREDSTSPKRKKKASLSKDTSQSPKRLSSKNVEVDTKAENYKISENLKRVILEGRDRSSKLSLESNISKGKTGRSDVSKSNSAGKRAKDSSKKSKKSKKHHSSEESDTDSEENRKKSKKKKSKKKVESSTESSSSEESSSSSEEEIVKKKSKRKSKKDNRKRQSKKTKRRRHSSSSSSDSSSGSESDSSSSSDSSNSDNHKKKKSKKKGTKKSSDSD